MMTPQEVASHAFARAAIGGYNMAMVDEFLDLLTDDYTTLYNDNAILKNKLKVLSETIEEYRATDNAMRKALLAAQQMADSMVAEAQQKRDQLMSEAEKTAAERIEQLRADIKAEEYRLKAAQTATAAYVRKLTEMHEREVDFLANLGELVPPEVQAAAAEADDPAGEIEAAVAAQTEDVSEPDPTPKPTGEEDPGSQDGGGEPTRRFDDLQFGKDYEIH